MSFRVPRVAALLFCSGMCALIYQVAWFRELRLIFGASTASSAAVLAVFMGGLGLGGARLGKVADRAKNALALYGNLELGVALCAAVTPLLVYGATTVYLGAGGSTTLGMTVATLLRLVLSVLVLAPATFLMGGTLPAAARAVEREGDPERRRVATLYGVNTIGAVVGAVLANFVMLEVFGTRMTLWAACLVNALVAIVARSMSRSESAQEAPIAAEPAKVEIDTAHGVSVADRTPWFPPVASALAGFTFMLMELTWYRMLAPILGGSSYTFGLILAIALVGIGIGGGIYSRTRVNATFRAFALTCALEAVFIAIPYALGDRIAIATVLLRPFCRVSFAASIGVWAVVAGFVVLPAAIVSGAQFPLVIGLYGRGDKKIGQDVGMAYLANTLGAIGGSLAGGFGLIPLLGAVACWRLAVFLLVGGSALALFLDTRHGGRRDPAFVRGVLVTATGLLLVSGIGPTGVWRHSGIGAGRADNNIEPVDAQSVGTFTAYSSRDRAWEEDGVESSVALGYGSGYAFIVNGKSDGHAIIDSPTQVMSGLLPALLHPNPKSTMVVGLGTGSTAGWLGAVPSMDRVDVVELEPAILRVAKDCAPVNRDVLSNPKVHIQLADAREVLRATPSRYDIIFSEPSNPYRSGISSMYTVEYYRATAERLNPGGYFVQWLQAYEVDGWAVATAITTIRQVYGEVDVWVTTPGDLLIVATVLKKPPVDVARLRARLAEEPFASAARATWRTDSVEGVFAHFVASNVLSENFLQYRLGAVNTDDQNFLEFAFARSVGRRRVVDRDLHALASRLRIDMPVVNGDFDPDAVTQERWLMQAYDQFPLTPPPHSRPDLPLGKVISDHVAGKSADALIAWKNLKRKPQFFQEVAMVAELAGKVGGIAEVPLVEQAPPGERDIYRAVAHARGGDPAGAVASLSTAFTMARTTPWIAQSALRTGLELATQIGTVDKRFTRPLHAALTPSFAVEAQREARLTTIARLVDGLKDPDLCVKAFTPLEPPPLDRSLLRARAECYTLARHPLAKAATDDYIAFVENNAALGESIPTPQFPPSPAKVAPTHPGTPSSGAPHDDNAPLPQDASADAPDAGR